MASLGGPGVLRVGRVGLGPVASPRVGREPGGVLLDPGGGPVRAGLHALWMPGTKRNLAQFSQQFTNAVWGELGMSSVVDNAATAPDGTQTAASAVPGTNGILAQNVPVSANTDYTFSIWLRSVSGANVALSAGITTTAYVAIAFGPITVTGSWQRFTFTGNSGANTTLKLLLGSGSTWAGTAKALYVWGAQLNAGSAPLAYEQTTDNQTVPDLSGNGNTLTNGSTGGVDSNDMVVTNTGLLGNATSEYATSTVNPSAVGSLECEFTYTTEATEQVLVGSDNGSNGRCYISVTSGGKLAGGIGAQTSTTIVGTTTLIAGQSYHAALTWDGTTVTLYLSGNVEYTGAQSGSVNTTVPVTVGALNTSGTKSLYSGCTHGAGLLHTIPLNAGQVRQDYRYVKSALSTNVAVV